MSNRAEKLRTAFNALTEVVNDLGKYDNITLKPSFANALNTVAEEAVAIINELEAEDTPNDNG